MSWATSLLPISLEQLSTRATLIIYGEVVSNQVKKDEPHGHIVTFTEFNIIELIKGNAGDSHTIKQIGGSLKESNIRLRIHGVPEFVTGKEYVVFLPEKSQRGFSSPLGLHQGAFSVESINGEKIVSNGSKPAPQVNSGNRSINIPLAINPENPTQSNLNNFINTVRAYNIQ